MDRSRAIAPRQSPADELRAELQAAQGELRQAEAALAEEQAAVNAFRMHARLMLDDLADAIAALLAEKQSLLTRLALLRQDAEAGAADDDPLSPADDDRPPAADGRPSSEDETEDLPLPTPTTGDKAAEKRLYRELARRFHPDLAEGAAELAYRTSVMTAINAAYTAGDVQALYDLAGELEPGELRELAALSTREERQLRQRLLQCRRRQRKVARQLEALRQDKTARLWRKARALEDPGQDWWTAVRRDLEAARARLENEVIDLREEIASADFADFAD